VLVGASLQWVRVFSWCQSSVGAGVKCSREPCTFAFDAKSHPRTFVSPIYRANLKLKTEHTLACAQSDAKDLESKIFCAVLNHCDLSSFSRLWHKKESAYAHDLECKRFCI
jgi:hypothetical protein